MEKIKESINKSREKYNLPKLLRFRINKGKIESFEEDGIIYSSESLFDYIDININYNVELVDFNNRMIINIIYKERFYKIGENDLENKLNNFFNNDELFNAIKRIISIVEDLEFDPYFGISGKVYKSLEKLEDRDYQKIKLIKLEYYDIKYVDSVSDNSIYLVKR